MWILHCILKIKGLLLFRILSTETVLMQNQQGGNDDLMYTSLNFIHLYGSPAAGLQPKHGPSSNYKEISVNIPPYYALLRLDFHQIGSILPSSFFFGFFSSSSSPPPAFSSSICLPFHLLNHVCCVFYIKLHVLNVNLVLIVCLFAFCLFVCFLSSSLFTWTLSIKLHFVKCTECNKKKPL